MSEGLVKVTDKFGQTRKVANIFWDGEKYSVPIPFKGMPKNLRDQLKDLKTLPTDVWLNSYVKSGNALYNMTYITYDQCKIEWKLHSE